MSKMARTIPPIICTCLVVTALAACGRGASSGAVAQVGGYTITKAALNQWMTERIGESYYEVATHEVPPGLVSEPANYSACIASLKTVTPIPGEGRPQSQPTVAQLTSKCKELHQDIKTKALTYLLSSYESINFGAEHGIKITDEEIQQALKRVKAEQYPTEREFRHLLMSRRRNLSQEMFIIKNDLLQQKIEKMLKNGTQLSATFLKEATNAADTASCSPEYIVEGCKEYNPKMNTASSVPASVLLEEIARWRPETSHGFTGVPVT
jgi:hypothetical protein